MKIAVVGDVIIDEYVHGVVTRISPEAPVPVLNYTHTTVKNGGANNVFYNIKSLTNDVVMCTSNTKPPIKTRYMANGHCLLRVDADDRGGVWKTLDEPISDAEVVVVSDYDKGAITTFERFTGLKTIVDPKKNLYFYRGAWCIKPNKKEFAEYAGEWSSLQQLFELMKDQRDYLGVEHLIVTLGEEGVAYSGPNNEVYHIESEAQTVFDVTGAGDTFTAVLAYACASGYSMFDAISLANKAAGIAVSHSGTYVITKADLGIDVKQKVVFTNGCFDILHPGHIEYLKASRKLGDRLVVGLNSDNSVTFLKGASRPVNTESVRKYMLEQLPFVDEVVIFDDLTPLNLIKKLKPHIITKGGDYKPENVVGHEYAKVVIIPFVDGFSTTKMVERIRDEA